MSKAKTCPINREGFGFKFNDVELLIGGSALAWFRLVLPQIRMHHAKRHVLRTREQFVSYILNNIYPLSITNMSSLDGVHAPAVREALV